MGREKPKKVRWIGSSYDGWKTFPAEVQDVMGYALYLAQLGGIADSAKPLKVFKGASVLEVVEDFDSNTWRAIYTVKFKGIIYVLHAFQKKIEERHFHTKKGNPANQATTETGKGTL